MNEPETPAETRVDFVRQIVEDDIKSNKWGKTINTRFPPEPNGYLHIGHAKSICLNFGIAAEYDGLCNLRFDDTNPAKEDTEYVDAIKADVKWLGFDWGERLHFSSDYFEQLYDWAVKLINDGKAYVDSQTTEEIRQTRGTATTPGTESPFRDRTVEENLELFAKMRAGEFADGECVLRAKIEMASKQLILRDPLLYRIRHENHHRTGDAWCIYPMYDYAHGQSDSLEGITHSICTLEFENHRPLYDWLCQALEIHNPQQIEFARLSLTYTITSKRKLLELVENKDVHGWNDPRMPTISGLRRRGYTPESIRTFCNNLGVTKFNSLTDMVVLENAIREDLNKTAVRRMGVLRPLKVVITNYPDDQTEEFDAVNHPGDESFGKRKVPFSKVLYIEQDDFMEDPPKKFYRLGVGREVRLRSAYFVKCTDFVKDADGNVTEVHCTYDPETRGGNALDGRKVKATMHWVSAEHSVAAEVRLYDHLFNVENPTDVAEGVDWKVNLNPASLEVVTAQLEPSLANFKPGDRCQFERLGYFCSDVDSTPGKPIFNRTVTLRDAWAKVKSKAPQKGKGKQKQKQKGQQKQKPDQKPEQNSDQK